VINGARVVLALLVQLGAAQVLAQYDKCDERRHRISSSKFKYASFHATKSALSYHRDLNENIYFWMTPREHWPIFNHLDEILQAKWQCYLHFGYGNIQLGELSQK